MRLETTIIDTGDPYHGMCIGNHASLYEFHGQNCHVRIEPQEFQGEGKPEYPKVWEDHAFMFFDRQTDVGCTVGRTPELEKFHLWRCRVDIGKVAFETLKTEDVQEMLGVKL